jgi:hypothetical protein
MAIRSKRRSTRWSAPAGRLPYLSRRPAFARPSSENGGDSAAPSPPSPKPLEKAPNGKEGEAFSAPRQRVGRAARNYNQEITLPALLRGASGARLAEQSVRRG